jgi:Tol biopolymer transport system component
MKKICVQSRTLPTGFDRLKIKLRAQYCRQLLLWLATAILLMTVNLIVCRANVVPTQSISVRNPAVPLTAGGDGDSIAPAISPDGRYVVFSSVANDLTPGGNDRFVLNVYLRDRTAGTTILVSTNISGTGGGNDNSALPQVSTNGQLVVFQSDASDLVPNDINGATDIFVGNVVAGTTALVSMAPDGTPGNGPSTDPIMTPDGRYVAFLSSATNLTSGITTNGMPDLFVRDLILGTNYLVNAGVTNGGNVAMTPDGRYVAFFSTITNLVSGVPATSRGEVYLWDRLSGTTTWASTNAATLASNYLGQINAPSYHPRLSDNGRYVTFKVGGTTNAPPGSGVALVLLYDAATATTTVINTNANGLQIGLDDSYGPEITPDGEFTAYVQHEGNLGSNYCSVHVWDSQGAVDTLVSDPGSNGVITTTSTQPVLSAAGWFVAFLSNATNLVDDPVLSGFHIYLRNYVEGSLQLVDEDLSGTGSTDQQFSLFSLSRYGRYVAFDSSDGNLVGGDNNQALDVFVRDLFLSTAEMDSRRNAGVIPQTGDRLCASQVSVSTNGQWVAFASAADDLVPNDTNNEPDVFVRDLLTGTTTLVSVGASGGPAWDSPSVGPVISGPGRYVVFISAATNLVTGQGVTAAANVFRRDLQTATTVLVSVSTNGVDGANGDCSSPVISQDGRYIAFLSGAGNLVPGVGGLATGFYRTFLRDVNSGTTTALTNGFFSVSPNSVFPPSMSADGRYAAYSAVSGGSSQSRVWDDQLGTDIYIITNNPGSANALLNANGTRVLYQSSPSTRVDDILTGTNVFIFNYTYTAWGAGAFSADGRFVAMAARTNITATTNIYLFDLQTQTASLVSSNYTPLPGSAGNADLPAVSTDGRFVVYRSYAAIVPGDNSPVPNIYRYDRLLGTNSNLTAGQAGLSPVLWDSRPVVNGNGGTVAFLSLGSGLVLPDLNRAPDSFAYAIDIGTALDSDGDGLPDWWMIQYFGHPTGQAGDHSLALDDADGDGMSNQQEFLAGTDPTTPLSALRMTSVAVIKPGPELDVSWNSVSNKLYFLQRSSSLATLPASPVLQSNIVGQAGTTTYQDTTAVGPGPYFYRVGVQQ